MVRAFSSKCSMNMLAMMGLMGEPIAAPSFWEYTIVGAIEDKIGSLEAYLQEFHNLGRGQCGVGRECRIIL